MFVIYILKNVKINAGFIKPVFEKLCKLWYNEGWNSSTVICLERGCTRWEHSKMSRQLIIQMQSWTSCPFIGKDGQQKRLQKDLMSWESMLSKNFFSSYHPPHFGGGFFYYIEKIDFTYLIKKLCFFILEINLHIDKMKIFLSK